MLTARIEPDFASWKTMALSLLSDEIPPQEVHFTTETQSLLLEPSYAPKASATPLSLPRPFVEGSRLVAAHRDSTCFHLLYRLLWRLTHGEKRLLEDPLDPDTREFELRKKAVTRDMHKMKAFVRFKKIHRDGVDVFTATHFPDHRILRLVSPFFKDRFQGMNWVIKTPDETALWDQEELRFLPSEEHLQTETDSEEELWKTYYAAIFNPARIKLKAMTKEMPKRHWKSMPETELIDTLIDEAPERLRAWQELLPESPVKERFTDLKALNDSLSRCRSCEICPRASGPVPGAGKLRPRIMLIGEQPGDEEDLAGRPFIGPAGQLLDEALGEAELDRGEMYVTNAVKGFKFLPKNLQRWHKGASMAEVATCRPWLANEVDLVAPEIIVCLGRTAAQSVLGKLVKMEEVRGKFFRSSFSPMTFVLPHPASILRTLDPEEKAQARRRFVEELRILKQALQHFDEKNSRV